MNIQFLYPEFLYALFAVAIPIIIHLFNFRRYKTVYFSNVRFLKNIKEETQSKSKLKHILVLISRILAIIALVLAFAQPYIPDTKDNKVNNNQIVSIYIDNSFSMEADSKFGNILEVAKNKAINISNTYKANAKFLLITNDLNPKHQYLVNKEQFKEFVQEVSPTPIVKKLSEIYSRQKDFILETDKETANGTIFLLSDFQQSTSDMQAIKNDSLIDVHLMPLSTKETNNLYIDTCWYEKPSRQLNMQEDLYVKVVNNSAEAFIDIPIKLFLNDTLKSLNTFSIDSSSVKTIKLSYTNIYTGIVNGKVEINDYPIVYDNNLFFNYSIDDNISILAINDDKESEYINALFAEEKYFELENSSYKNLDYSTFTQYNVIILNQIVNISTGLSNEITQYIDNGGTVLFLPNENGSIETYNSMFKQLKTVQITSVDTQQTKVKRLDDRHYIYENVFKKIDKNAELPIIYKHFVYRKNIRSNNIDILSTRNNHSILSETRYGKGKIFISAVPLTLEASNLVKHPIFLPAVYNICLNSQQNNELYYTIGNDNSVQIDYIRLDKDPVFYINNRSNTQEFIPQHQVNNSQIRLHVNQNISNADNYIVRNNKVDICGLSFNYNRDESNLKYYTPTQLQDFIANNNLFNFSLLDVNDKYLSNTLEKINHGKQFWKLLLILSLIFIAIEILLLRLFR